MVIGGLAGLVLVFYGVLAFSCWRISRKTGFPIPQLMRAPSFTQMREKPELSRASHKAWLLSMFYFWLLLMFGGAAACLAYLMTSSH